MGARLVISFQSYVEIEMPSRDRDCCWSLNFGLPSMHEAQQHEESVTMQPKTPRENYDVTMWESWYACEASFLDSF